LQNPSLLKKKRISKPWGSQHYEALAKFWGAAREQEEAIETMSRAIQLTFQISRRLA